VCGVVGYFGATASRSAGRAELTRMVGALRHRGPDALGYHVEDGVGFGHARLSIIDIAGGQQPMAGGDDDTWITFNGEIFNYVELRQALVAEGVRFRTQSDTEVILKLYEKLGPRCVESFNGDFAFAIWDRRRRQLFMARDRMGVRPLFHASVGGKLYFASEVKALLEVPGLTAELDPIALDQTFTFWFPLAPRTHFKSISELPPGHLLVAREGHVEIKPYWRLEYPDADADRADRRSEAEIAEEVRALLIDATRIRLRSDVPVGSYLSGGLDSSIVTAAAKGLVADRLTSFSIGFEEAEYDESAFQEHMVAALGTEHHSFRCRNADIARVFPDVVRAAERPMLRTAPAPLFLLSQRVQDRGFKVVLTGEGADEVFAGYDIFKEAAVRRFCARQPGSRFRSSLFKRLYPYLPGLQGQSPAYLEAFFKARPEDLADPLFSHLPRFRNTAAAKVFFSDDLRRELAGYDAFADLRARLPADFTRWHRLSQAQYLETAHLLPGYILCSQGDRVAMAHAVEGRFPFLDHRLVEFAARIPPRLKLKGLREKHILRKAARDMLPPLVGNRPKQPYRAPDAQSFAGAAPSYVEACLAPATTRQMGYFDPTAVAKLDAKRRNGRIVGFRDGVALVGVLSTALWHQSFCRNPLSNNKTGGHERASEERAVLAIEP